MLAGWCVRLQAPLPYAWLEPRVLLPRLRVGWRLPGRLGTAAQRRLRAAQGEARTRE